MLLKGMIYGPLLETLIFQIIPLEFARFLNIPKRIQFPIGVLIFAYPHIAQNPLPGLVAGLFSGSFLVLTYLMRRDRSLEESILSTCILHSVHNGYIIGMATFWSELSNQA